MLTSLKRIPSPRGAVLRAMRASDPGYEGFGEAYFSQVLPGCIKGWKRHRRMTLNLVVAAGAIRFVLHDGVDFQSMVLSPESSETHKRLTVGPGLWMAFRGEGDSVSTLLNIANIPHDPDEAENRDVEAFSWQWPC